MSSTTALHAMAFATLFSIVGGCARPNLDADVAGAESAQSSPSPSPSASATGRVGSHGMVVAGTPSEAFLSHIPMFRTPHDVQLLAAGAFVPVEASSPLPASFADELFTFLPDRMSLDALRTGALREVTGTLFVGNFESGGRPVPGRVRFEVSRIVHQHVLGESTVPASTLSYFVFGSRRSEQAFAVHRLTTAPGFDEILRVTLDGDAPSDEELALGVVVQLADNDDMSTRLGTLAAPATATAGGRTFSIAKRVELSCLEGPDFTNACP